MNRLSLALPAFIIFILFAPSFVSANGIDALPTTELVEETVQKTKETVNRVSETVKESIEEPSLSEPVNSSVDIVNEVVEPVVEKASIPSPVKEPVTRVVKETENTVKETTKKIDESLVKPVIEPIDESVLKPVEKTTETVKERHIVSETVDHVEQTVRETEEMLKEPADVPVIKEEKQSKTTASKTVDEEEELVQQKVSQVGVKETETHAVHSVEPLQNFNGEAIRYQGTNDPIDREHTSKQVAEPVNSNPLPENKPLTKPAIPAQTIQAGAPSVTVKASSDLGISAFLELLTMDFEADARWRNDEVAGKSQWSHAPPGEPPKSLSFL